MTNFKFQSAGWRIKILKTLCLLVLLAGFFIPKLAQADELAEIEKQIAELSRARQMSEEATQPLESELNRLETKINNIKASISKAKQNIINLESNIEKREQDFDEKYIKLAQSVESYYKHLRQPSAVYTLFSAEKTGEMARDLAYQQSVADNDKKIIQEISQEIIRLETDKKQVEADKAYLAELQKKVDKEAAFFRKEIAGAKAYQAELSEKIAELSARQKEILNARAGTFTSSVGDVPTSNIACSGPPGSPSYCDPGGGDWFAAFSFGAWTHRKGMSQYGAKGRAESGQNYQDILEAYYGKRPVDKDTGGTISVSGYGDLEFDGYYLYGIAEMPSSWHKEALKAQAVAARTYAYRYKTENRPICTTQACQVFNNGKAASPPEAWRQAVNETKGEVLEDVITYYSSTAGGYLTYPRGVWDTTDGQGGVGFASRAWGSIAGSPWFYSSWFTQNYTASSAKCSRSHPWLSSEEMADILNAWVVLDHQGGDERILPETINQCPIGGNSGNPYSKDELRNRAASFGQSFRNVSGVSVSYSNNGSTSSLSFSANSGSVSISGADFKQAFNLRAPGYIAIRSPLFNVEKK